jgi:hypothetical protein
MIRRALYHIAGVDRETIGTCPATDREWAAHIGFALLLSFLVVLGIAYHAASYVIANNSMRLVTAIVVALTVFMFDRALYQSDWFYQATSDGHGQANNLGTERWATLPRVIRITIRLTISFALAWVLALFLELAIFSDTIGERIRRDHLALNQGTFEKINMYEAELGGEIAQRRTNLTALDAAYRTEIAASPVAAPNVSQRLNEIEEQIKALDRSEQQLRTELREIDEQITRYAEEMNAERAGRKMNPSQSGRPGMGIRYQFANEQKDVYIAKRLEREKELSQLAVNRSELRSLQARVTADATTQFERQQVAADAKRRGLENQLESTRAELQHLEASRLTKLNNFKREALASSEFQKQKEDPLSRMAAYQELKNDPKDGATIVLFSWMTKCLIIFLEIVPVIAKTFFSPPSVYAARVKADIERGRRRLAGSEVRDSPERGLATLPAHASEVVWYRPNAR